MKGRLRRWSASTAVFLDMIKISHSVFALPFALAALFFASRGLPPPLLLLKVVLAVVAARTMAMSFNRWADAELDARNPRTRGRAIPAALLPRAAAGFATLAAACLFVLAAAWINGLAVRLSPLVIVVLLGYSYTKRFTQFSHVFLGLALGLSPMGAWVAARGELGLLPAVLGAAVLFWTAGFDIIYACQDIDFDRAEGLRSIPARWGAGIALWIARGFHLLTVGLLIAVGALATAGWFYAGGVTLVALLLIYEHSLVKPQDLSRVDQAFFLVNGMVSLAFLGSVVLDGVAGGWRLAAGG